MKNKLIILGTFFVGIIVGVIGYNFLLTNVLSSHRNMIRVQLAIEEEQRSTREERKGNNLNALLHRWNVARLENPETILTFSSKYSDESDKDWFAPISYVLLNKMTIDADPMDRAKKSIEAIHRGNLALLMEKIGFNELAESEWEHAAKLDILNDVEKLKSRVEYLRKSVDDDLQKRAEDAVLGPDISLQE
ncbi:MAG: hypothetical protein OEV42_13865 [Deltaproteobacteria bacterium]|nr:hypothetical protein [Deltaproteobacteria bacterium]